MAAKHINVVVAGARGRVGQAMMSGLSQEPDINVIGGFSRLDRDSRADLLGKADVLVDFTLTEASPGILAESLEAGVRVVSGTTGLSEQVLEEIDRTAQKQGIGAVWAPNFAIGAVLMMYFAGIAARYMPAAEVIEMHHDAKADAPSGTALSTARRIRASHATDLPDPPVQKWTLEGSRGGVEGGVRIHSVRLPGLVAHQEVLFGARGQVLSIRHDATGRETYVPGVALAVRSVVQPGQRGLVRGLATLMGLAD